MTMQVLDARDPTQVESSSFISADLGVAGRNLLVLSGIALIDWRYDSDVLWRGETQVRLGVFASNLEQWSSFVGLASIGNDDSSFVFAADTATVSLDNVTGELLLHINTALMGEWSYLGRISYQVVATVVRVNPHIGGVISWPKTLFKPKSLDSSLVAGSLIIMANRLEHITPSGGFAFDKLTPLTPGQIFKLEDRGDSIDAYYRIDNPQMAVLLSVTVAVGELFWQNAGGTVVAGQTTQPREFTLTASAPSMDNIDFAVSVLRLG
ncbi:hypothetical protein ACIQWS_09825 [Phyllobacterium sp. NPDC097923]|uniref:hypothetical protein n=1 Tax=Phyllobacterium sp. NPDC097923 TaxID=3364404 RepID=UPI00383BCECF